MRKHIDDPDWEQGSRTDWSWVKWMLSHGHPPTEGVGHQPVTIELLLLALSLLSRA